VPRSKRISIAINSLVQGGAQKAGILLVESLLKRGYSVQLILFYPEETDFFDIPRGAEVVRLIHPFEAQGIEHPNKYLHIYKRARSRLRDLRQLRREVHRHKSGHIIAFEAYVGILVGLALFGSKVKVLISERVHPKFHEIQSIVKPFQKFVYTRRNVKVLAQGEVISEYIRGQYGVEVLSIPNIVLPKPNEFVYEPKKRVVMMARAHHQKGIDVLIQAWAQLTSDQKLSWSIHIYGQGDFAPYRDLAVEKNVEREVHFHDADSNINNILEHAGIFVLPSRYEGFSNALAEAIAYGVPSIATDCPSAVRDLTLNGELAILIPVDDTNSLAFQLSNLIANEKKRTEIGEKGKQISTIFGSENVTDIWEDAIQGLFVKREKIRCYACDAKVSKARLSLSKSKLIQSYFQSYPSKEIESGLFDGLRLVIRFWECDKCGHLSTKGSHEVGNYYNYMHESTPYSRSSRWDYEYFSLNVKNFTSQTVLDFGSSDSKWNNLDFGENYVTLYDIGSINLGDHTNSIRYTNKLSDLPSNSQDHIVAFHVMEHLENPFDALIEMKTKLKNDGKIWISVPDKVTSFFEFSHLDWPPHHLSRFSRESLQILSERAGFSLIEYVPGVSNRHGMFDFMLTFKKQNN
jgi:GalNAc-alpha-(1->4)-GalNAc-alpha-(1->3)-diNAcBac-PP-undecaprenol alpha-1,4-N-acetyl-D-galactosaminyltransferase